jgi:hypothetical protein
MENQAYTEKFAAGCKCYIEGRYAQALKIFDDARDIQATIHVDLWRARTMMDMMEYFQAMQLLQWMIEEYENDMRVHTMIALAHLELITLQPKITEVFLRNLVQ